MAIIRIALDIEVEDKVAETVKDKIFEDREAIINYVRATTIPMIDSKVGDTKARGGNTHVHEARDTACSACRAYSERHVLTRL